ncbi:MULTISPECIES: hypothetical protein [unclassified Streptomyces]|uniref:hypothetical protein n=1 Tax=unclassified Streptomyces TaxID=2593676 RepID=UPI0036FCDFC6
MPRRRPGEVRTALPRRYRTHARTTVIDGLSRGALGEIDRLERARTHWGPGEVATAVRLWKDYVQTPERLLWQDHEWGSTHGDCCGGDPREARALLDTVMRALPARSARELRAVVARSDRVWGSEVG